MNENQIKNDIKKAMNKKVPDVLDKIKASPQFYVPKKQNGFSLRSLYNNKMFVSFMSIFVIALVIITAYNRSASPVVASTITLDINPSIQINLDENDYVVSLIGYNDAGEEIAFKEVNYEGLSLESCIELLITRLESKGYIVTTSEENNIILIDVQTSTESKQLELENKLQLKLNQELEKRGVTNNKWVMNAKDIQISEEQKQLIMQSKLIERASVAKLALIYRISALDQSYEVNDLVPLTIRELYEIFIELETPNNLPDYDKMPKPNQHNPNSYDKNYSEVIG